MICKMDFHGEGYNPVLITDGWQVAYLNNAPEFENPNQIEKHENTDEAFILLEGNAELFVADQKNGERTKISMVIGTLYNIPAGKWHFIKTYKGCRCLIVEKDNTHIKDVVKEEIGSSGF